MTSEAYRRAGVDLDAAAKAVELIRELGSGAARPELTQGVGGFAGLFEIGDGRYLAAATDGVGTKLEIARLAGRLDTVGIDLVAMCADDVVCTGAEPLFFLDYLAVGALEPERVAAIVSGVAEGCRRAGCALLGGETAEHPGVMAADAFDLAGFCVGVVDEDHRLGPDRVRDGDVLVGLASTGLHANGYSLVRDALLDRHPLDEVVPPLERPLVDELLEPTAIYAPLMLGLARDGLLHAAAHVTAAGSSRTCRAACRRASEVTSPGGRGRSPRSSTWSVSRRRHPRRTCARRSTSGSGWCSSFPPSVPARSWPAPTGPGRGLRDRGRARFRPALAGRAARGRRAS